LIKIIVLRCGKCVPASPLSRQSPSTHCNQGLKFRSKISGVEVQVDTKNIIFGADSLTHNCVPPRLLSQWSPSMHCSLTPPPPPPPPRSFVGRFTTSPSIDVPTVVPKPSMVVDDLPPPTIQSPLTLVTSVDNRLPATLSPPCHIVHTHPAHLHYRGRPRHRASPAALLWHQSSPSHTSGVERTPRLPYPLLLSKWAGLQNSTGPSSTTHTRERDPSTSRVFVLERKNGASGTE
jgi:hypothetical protein